MDIVILESNRIEDITVDIHLNFAEAMSLALVCKTAQNKLKVDADVKEVNIKGLASIAGLSLSLMICDRIKVLLACDDLNSDDLNSDNNTITKQMLGIGDEFDKWIAEG